MNDSNAERMLRKYKGFANSVKQMLKSEYKFMAGDKIQDMFIHDLPIENTRMVPVVLSIASQDDLKLRHDGYSAKEIRKCKVARILREAYDQGGVLNQADVSLLIGVSAGTIGKDIKEFQIENGVVLPYRGTIHDLGPTLTHKRIIIQQFVRNIPTPEIARRTSHSEEACDRYIKGFKKVQKLHRDGAPAENIASELEMSKSLVREYVEIVDELNKEAKGGK